MINEKLSASPKNISKEVDENSCIFCGRLERNQASWGTVFIFLKAGRSWLFLNWHCLELVQCPCICVICSYWTWRLKSFRGSMEIPVHDIVNTGEETFRVGNGVTGLINLSLTRWDWRKIIPSKHLLAGNLPASLGDFAFRVEKTGASHSNFWRSE